MTMPGCNIRKGMNALEVLVCRNVKGRVELEKAPRFQGDDDVLRRHAVALFSKVSTSDRDIRTLESPLVGEYALHRM